MDTYGDDLVELVTTLDLKNAIHVCHSTGGGEVARYIGRHGSKRVAKVVLIGAIPPLMVKTATDPGGLPTLHKAFDSPGPVLIGVHVDYRENHKLFEQVYESSVL